jgi:outer membrane protein TolC
MRRISIDCAALGCAFFLSGTLFVTSVQALSINELVPQRLRDPFGGDEKTAPSHFKRWEPTTALPTVGGVTPDEGAQLSHQALSLPELTEFAFRNNPKTRQTWLSARAAAAGVGVEQADLLPQISALYAGSRSQQVTSAGAIVAPQKRYGPTYSLSYLLYDFGVRDQQIAATEYRLLAMNLAHNRALQDVLFQVEQAYYRLIGNDALVQINAQSLANAEIALEAARKRQESGLATVADVYRADTLVAQAHLNLTRSRGELEKKRGQLAFVVGLPVNRRIAVRTLEAPPQSTEITTQIGDLLNRAKQTRPDLVAAEAQVRSAKASASAVARAGLPTIELVGGESFFDIKDKPSVKSWSVGFNVRIPIFTGFRDTYNARLAQAQADALEASRDALVRQAEIEVWQGYYDLTTVTSSISSTEAQVRSAEQTAQATLARYQGGFGSILDLITAQQDESNARVQRIQSYLEWFTTLSRLQIAVGAGDLLKTSGGAK